MFKLAATLIFSAVLSTSAKPIFEQNNVVDAQGKLILMQGDSAAAMSGPCKSLRIQKNPPIVPRLKCRFS